MKPIYVSEIADFLNFEKYVKILVKVISLDKAEDNLMVFSKKKKIDSSITKTLILVLLNFEYDVNCSYSVIKVKNLRLSFAKVVDKFFIKEDKKEIENSINCKIGKNTIITACAEISGSVSIGQNCWIGPNSSIIQKVKISDKVTIEIGSIVTKDIKDNKKIMGLKGLDLKTLLKVKKKIEYGK